MPYTNAPRKCSRILLWPSMSVTAASPDSQGARQRAGENSTSRVALQDGLPVVHGQRKSLRLRAEDAERFRHVAKPSKRTGEGP